MQIMEKGETGMKRKEIREEIEDKIKEGEVIGGKYEVIEVVEIGRASCRERV